MNDLDFSKIDWSECVSVGHAFEGTAQSPSPCSGPSLNLRIIDTREPDVFYATQNFIDYLIHQGYLIRCNKNPHHD